MSAPNITSLLGQASCFQCLSPAERSIVKLGLLSSWLPLPARDSRTEAWYASYRAGTLTQVGGRVSNWADLSGHGRDLAISIPSEGFLYNAGNAGSNNVPYLGPRVVGTVAFKTGAFTLNQPCTFYVLARQTALTAGGISGDIFDGRAGNNSAGIVIAANTSTVNLNLVAGFNTAIPGGLNTWAVFTAIFNSTTSFLQVNRVAAITGNAGAVSPSGFVLGTRSDGGRVPVINVIEAIVRSGADDAATRDAFQLYLAARVGLTI